MNHDNERSELIFKTFLVAIFAILLFFEIAYLIFILL